MFNLFFVLSVLILTSGCYLILNRNNKKPEEPKDEPSDGYLKARQIFVRDPEAFKDVDKDGIDDIIDPSK